MYYFLLFHSKNQLNMTKNQLNVLYNVNSELYDMRKKLALVMNGEEPMDTETYNKYRKVYDAIRKVQQII